MKFLFSFVLVSAQLTTFAQLNKVADLNLTNVSTASVDRLGNFYFVLPSGTLQKYDPDGNLLDEAKEGITPLTLLEPWNPLKVFTCVLHWQGKPVEELC